MPDEEFFRAVALVGGIGHEVPHLALGAKRMSDEDGERIGIRGGLPIERGFRRFSDELFEGLMDFAESIDDCLDDGQHALFSSLCCGCAG